MQLTEAKKHDKIEKTRNRKDGFIMKSVKSKLVILAALLCLSACGSENTPIETDTGLTGTDTEEVITTAPLTEAVTEAVPDESTLYLDELADYVVTPKPIRRENDPVDMNAGYNKPKVALAKIVEGLIKEGTYVGKDGWFFYKDS